LNNGVQNKKALRRLHRERLRGLEPEKRKHLDAFILQNIISLPEFQSARTIMTYLSISGEVDTFPLARLILKRGKRLVVPKVIKEPAHLLACEIDSLDEGLVPDPYGIMEPDRDHTREIRIGEIDVHVIPGLAFDRSGYRLGHGGGYYDRFLSGVPKSALKAGLSFGSQILDALPKDPWDIPVDCIISEKEVLRVSRFHHMNRL